MALTKPAGAWTYGDLLALPDDARYEIIDGERFERPAPSVDHQQILVNLLVLLAPIVRGLGGRLLSAPLDVFFPGADPVEPDILILLPGWGVVLPPRGPVGAPDLVIEILSPSNRTHDLVTKRALYARGGVREYWIVDPAMLTIDVLVLADGAFRREQLAFRDETVSSPLLGAAAIPAAEIFAGLGEGEG